MTNTVAAVTEGAPEQQQQRQQQRPKNFFRFALPNSSSLRRLNKNEDEEKEQMTDHNRHPHHHVVIQPMHRQLQEELNEKTRLLVASSNSASAEKERREEEEQGSYKIRDEDATTTTTTNPFVQPEILSNSWWLRLIEWSNVISQEEEEDRAKDGLVYVGEGGGIIPETRRSHSATIYRIPYNGKEEDCDENVESSTAFSSDAPAPVEEVEDTLLNISLSEKNDFTNSAQNNQLQKDISNNYTNIGNGGNRSAPITKVGDILLNMSSSSVKGNPERSIDTDTNGTHNNSLHTNNNHDDNITSTKNETNRRQLSSSNPPHYYDQEYMIISGGFSDTDWTNFPIWAFDVTSTIISINEEDHSSGGGRGQWIDLTPPLLSSENDFCQQEEEKQDISSSSTTESTFTEESNQQSGDGVDDAWKHAKSCPPEARVGHISWMYNGYLYVFGGLLWDKTKTVFRSERLPFVYRIQMEGMLPPPSSNPPINRWQRIMPKISHPQKEIYDDPIITNATNYFSKTYNTLLRGEVKGGLWKHQDKLIIYGGLSVQNVESSPPASSYTSSLFTSETRPTEKFQQVDTPLGDVWSYDLKTDTWEQMDIDPEEELKEAIIEDSVLHSSSFASSTTEEEQEEIEEEILEKEEETIMNYPTPRTSHAATVVNNKFIIYGGMTKIGADPLIGATKWEELSDVWIFDLLSKQWKRRDMEPSLKRSYHSLVGWDADDGDEIDDVIGTTGGGNGVNVASFGGYTVINQPMDDTELGFVFDDTLVSHLPFSNLIDVNYNTKCAWMKAAWPYDATEGVSNRREHTAVLSEVWGTMYVWGGKFQETRQIDGMWMLNVAGENSQVTYRYAEPDGLEAYGSVGAFFHMIATLLMFLSMLLTAMCGVVNRHDDDDEEDDSSDDEDGAERNDRSLGAFSIGRRRTGLRQDVIDSLPVKTYRGGMDQDVMTDRDMVSVDGDETSNTSQEKRNELRLAVDYSGAEETVSGGGTEPTSVIECENDRINTATINESRSSSKSEENDCCAICLVEYEEGDKVRTLPCGHEFHIDCVDPWLGNSASCPACRHSLRGLSSNNRSSPTHIHMPLQERIALRFLMSRHGPLFSQSGSGDVRGADAHDSAAEVGIDNFVVTDDLDLSYISSLELVEEVMERRPHEENVNTSNENDIQSASLDQQQISGRMRMMRLRNDIANRGSSQIMGRRRRIRRGSRMFPLNDPLDPSGEIQDGGTVLV